MFWKKDEFGDLDNGDLGKDFGGMNDFGKDTNNLGMPGLTDFSNTPVDIPQSPSPLQMNRFDRQREIIPQQIPLQQSNYQQYPVVEQSNPGSKDIELISVKLDSIRNTLEIMNQRIARIEKIAEGEQQERRWV